MNEVPVMQYDQRYYPHFAEGQYDQYQEGYGEEYDDTYYDPAYHGYNSHLWLDDSSSQQMPTNLPTDTITNYKSETISCNSIPVRKIWHFS